MPLYAFDEKKTIYAADATPQGLYRCLECGGRVKVRRGKYRTPHFYHMQAAPSCRLYSKSEDHLLIQLQVQNLLLPEKIQIEAPFLALHRIADLLWEKEKIIFEIQCSLIQPKEAEARIKDYRKIGYEVIWLLDDRLFNRRNMKPAENFLRVQCCYFFRFRRNTLSLLYDQFEIEIANKRIRTSRPLWVNLAKPYWTPKIEWPPFLPLQLIKRLPNCPRFFKGDLIDKAIQSSLSPSITFTLTQWKLFETESALLKKKTGAIKYFFKRTVLRFYTKCLGKILRKVCY